MSDFLDDELYYRRMRQPSLSDGRPDLSEFSTSDMSGAISRFCESESDVLYNSSAQDPNDHFLEWGIFCLSLESIKSVREIHPVTQRVFQAFGKHVPVECFYPHMEVQFKDKMGDYAKVTKVLKTAIKEKLRHLAVVLKEPS